MSDPTDGRLTVATLVNHAGAAWLVRTPVGGTPRDGAIFALRDGVRRQPGAAAGGDRLRRVPRAGRRLRLGGGAGGRTARSIDRDGRRPHRRGRAGESTAAAEDDCARRLAGRAAARRRHRGGGRRGPVAAVGPRHRTSRCCPARRRDSAVDRGVDDRLDADRTSCAPRRCALRLTDVGTGVTSDVPVPRDHLIARAQLSPDASSVAVVLTELDRSRTIAITELMVVDTGPAPRRSCTTPASPTPTGVFTTWTDAETLVVGSLLGQSASSGCGAVGAACSSCARSPPTAARWPSSPDDETRTHRFARGSELAIGPGGPAGRAWPSPRRANGRAAGRARSPHPQRHAAPFNSAGPWTAGRRGWGRGRCR